MASNNQPIVVIARLLDLTERRVQQLARDYVRYLREQAVRSQSGIAGAERARLVKAKADLAEMDAGARRSDLLPKKPGSLSWHG